MKELFQGLGDGDLEPRAQLAGAAAGAAAGGGFAAPVEPAPAPAQGGTQPLTQPAARPATGGPIDPMAVLRAVRAKWYIVLFVTAFLTGALGAVVLKRIVPSYAAEALVSVEPIVPTVAYTGEEWRAQSIQGFYSDYVRTLVRLAKTPDVAAAAVAELAEDGIDWLPEGVDPVDAPAHLAARLDVRQVRDTQLISVRFEDKNSAIVGPVANAAANSLLTALDLQQNTRVSENSAALAREAERLEKELAGVNASLDALSEPLGSAMADERHNIFFERIDALQESWAKALLVAADAESEMARTRAEAERLLTAIPEGELQAMVDDDPAVRDARVMLGRLARDEESQSGHLSDVHPERMQALQRLREAADRVKKVEEDSRTRLRDRLTQERAEKAATITATSEARVLGSQRALDRIQNELEEARNAFRDHGRAMFDATQLRAESGRIRSALDRLTSREEVLRTESNAPGRASVAAPAITPRKPASDRRKLALMASGVLSLFVGVLTAAFFGRHLIR